jgi:hypothetical protein
VIVTNPIRGWCSPWSLSALILLSPVLSLSDTHGGSGPPLSAAGESNTVEPAVQPSRTHLNTRVTDETGQGAAAGRYPAADFKAAARAGQHKVLAHTRAPSSRSGAGSAVVRSNVAQPAAKSANRNQLTRPLSDTPVVRVPAPTRQFTAANTNRVIAGSATVAGTHALGGPNRPGRRVLAGPAYFTSVSRAGIDGSSIRRKY